MALNIDQYVCNENVVYSGTVYYTRASGECLGNLNDIRVTHERIILSGRESDEVDIYLLKKICCVYMFFNDGLNMWTIHVSCGYCSECNLHVSQLDWANLLFNNLQYYSVFN